MSIARVSDLPSQQLSDLTLEQRMDSMLEMSINNQGEIDGTEVQTWNSRKISYGSLRQQLGEDIRGYISAATGDSYGLVKLGFESDPDNYRWALSVDQDGRAFIQSRKDPLLNGVQIENWQFVLSTESGTPLITTKKVLVAQQ